MAPDAAEAKPAEPPTKAKFADRVSDVAKWAVGALAAAGTFAVSKMSFDRLGKGDYGGDRATWAFVCLIGFALGVALIVITVIWTARASRVTLAYLRSRKHFIGKQVRERLEKTPYLLNGETKLADFVDKLNALIVKRAADPVAFGANATDRRQLSLMLNARRDALDTAKAERTALVNAWATAVLLFGAAVVAASAAGYGFVTNQAVQIEEEADKRNEDVIVGELRPATPSQVLMVVPEKDARRGPLQSLLGAECELRGVAALAIDIATPPEGNPKDAIVRVVSERTAECSVQEVWAPPGWLLPRPQERASSSGSTTSTTQPPAGGTDAPRK
jgi:hypothetical protein